MHGWQVVHRNLHMAPQRPWNIERLARETATSRTRLTDRFNRVLGEPPMSIIGSPRRPS